MRRAPTRPIIVAQVAGVQLRRICQSPSGANLIISLVTSLRVRRDRASECDMATATRCSLTSPVTKTVLSLNNEGASIVGASYLRKSKAWSGSARYLPSPAGRRRPMFPQPPISAPHLAFLRRLPRKRERSRMLGELFRWRFGISNMFLPNSDRGAFAAGCVAVLARVFPRLPVVCLCRAGSVGCTPVSGDRPVKIWVRIAD